MKRSRCQKASRRHKEVSRLCQTTKKEFMSLPTSTYIQSSHVEHMRFDLSPLKSPCYSCLRLFLLLSSVLVWCSAVFFMQVHDWPLGPRGLLHDRSWMVVNENGVCLNQKRVPRLCLIRPEVHLPSNHLLLKAPGQTESVAFTENMHKPKKKKIKYINLLSKDLKIFFPWCRNEYYFCSPEKQRRNSHELSSVSEQSLWWQVSWQCLNI